MLKKDPNHTRLKIGGRGWNGSASYWLGPDHLLVVEVVNYVERYRRFYFRDIQAVVVQQSRQQLWVNLTLGMLALLVLVIVGSAVPTAGNWSDEAAFGVGIGTGLGLVFLGGMVVNTLRGRTCSVHVRTAVQTQKLKNLSRWRAAERMLEQLQPRVLAAQSSPTLPAAEANTSADSSAGAGSLPPSGLASP